MADQTSTIPKGWKMTTLGEVADIKGGKRLPKDKNLVNYKTKHPYIRITDLENNQIKKNQLQFVPDEVFPSISRYIVNSGDVIVSIVGSIGFVARIDNDLDNASLTENCVKFVNLKNLDSKFLYYYLISKLGQDEIIKNTVGAVQKKLPIYGVQNIQISLSSLPEQRAIASVLSSLDDKIELLREQNKTLESTAQAIFKEWFVNFNFPSATNKMIDSELGKIPDGWRAGKLGEVTDIRGGTTPSTQNPDFWNGNIAWTSPKDLSNSKGVFLLQTEKKITEEGLRQIGSGLLPEGTLLLSSRAPIGYLAITNLDVAINQGYIAFLPDQYFSNNFMFLWLKVNMETVIGSANGSTFLEISKSSFRNIDCIVPDSGVLVKFNTAINALFNKMLSNTLQIQTLSTLRDTLLPKLMKGEVRVEGFKN